MSTESDRDLLLRFVHGDRAAFEALFRAYEHDVYRWILRIVRNGAAAEDGVVEAFWRCYRSRARFDPSRDCGVPVGMALYYLVWKHAVGFLNREVGIA